MESFNAIKYCEDLLGNHDIFSLASLEKALQEVKKQVDSEKDIALKGIEKVQASIHQKGGMDVVYNLLERQERAHKDLESARVLVKELNHDYEDTSKILEEKVMQMKNGVLLKDLIIELDNFNSNQYEIEVEPKHLIYLKHSLESLDLPEFNTVSFYKGSTSYSKEIF